MVEIARRTVDDTTRGHAHPQRAAAVPTAQIASGTGRQGCQRRGLRTPRCRCLDDVERAAEQIGGHDAGRARADVQAQRQVGLVIDLDGHSRPADGAGDGQIGPFPQHAGVEQRRDLTVDRRDAELGDLGYDVTRDRTAQSGGAEHGSRGGLGHPQRGRYDMVAGQERALGVSGRCGGMKSGGGSAHGIVLL
jgi:hypothetical protein